MDKASEAALKRACGMLEAVLERQIVLHRAMLEAAGEKRESIIRGDLPALEAVVSKERELVARIEDEERKRQAVMPMLRRGLGVGDDVEKLSDIANMTDDPEKTRLLSLADELKTVVEEVRKITRHNSELLKASLEHVDAFLRTVAEAAHPGNSYRRDGSRPTGPTLIDRNA
ncbi:MAG: flagellar protein FlgN [Planctomycetota bacterium]|jgi:flagellar biosynthesis/type III secretory pathway chaperone|nr:flagellar protein FlgN [Planctomycetota bacterium]